MLKPGDVAPDFAVQDHLGRTVRLSDFRGKVRVFDVWASWCGPCRMGIPELNALYEHYREKGVVVVGISLDDTPADVARFVEEVPIHYPNGMMNPDLAALLGIGNEAMAIPITYVVDRTGKLRAKFVRSARILPPCWSETRAQSTFRKASVRLAPTSVLWVSCVRRAGRSTLAGTLSIALFVSGTTAVLKP